MRVLLAALGQLAPAMEKKMQVAGHRTYTTDIVDEVHDLAVVYDYDCVVIGPEGRGIIKPLHRAMKGKTPIIAVVDDIQQRGESLVNGADDCWTTTIDAAEMTARLKAITRRRRGGLSLFEFGPFVINYTENTVECGASRVSLTDKEYQMLELMSTKPNQAIRKEEFIEHLFGLSDQPELSIIDVFATKLRRKLSQASGGIHGIETVWGVGYKLNPNPQSKPY